MAGGNNSAKKIVVGEANKLAEDLQNGHTGDQAMMARLQGLMVKMLTPLYMNEFVTVDECGIKHKKATPKSYKLKIGPIAFEGVVTSAVLRGLLPLVQTGVIIFVLGRTVKWW